MWGKSRDGNGTLDNACSSFRETDMSEDISEKRDRPRRPDACADGEISKESTLYALHDNKYKASMNEGRERTACTVYSPVIGVLLGVGRV